MQIEDISDCFVGKGNTLAVSQLGIGNINKSYIITTKTKRYILQRINTNVFKNPILVCNNVMTVTKHLQNKNIKTLSFIKARFDDEDQNFTKLCSGGLLYRKNDRSYWRMMKYIENTKYWLNII